MRTQEQEIYFNDLYKKVSQSLSWAAQGAGTGNSLDRVLSEFEAAAQKIFTSLESNKDAADVEKAICLLLSEAGKYAALINATRKD